MMDLNEFGKRALASAIKRGKVSAHTQDKDEMHYETVESLYDEVREVISANEDRTSEHLPSVSETAEELADVAIVVMTELTRRNIDVEKLLLSKMEFNERRSD